MADASERYWIGIVKDRRCCLLIVFVGKENLRAIVTLWMKMLDYCLKCHSLCSYEEYKAMSRTVRHPRAFLFIQFLDEIRSTS